MRKKIYKIILFGLIGFLPLWSAGQVCYANDEATFEILENAGRYEVKCKLIQDIPGSRRLQRASSRMRLKAVDLVGNYIVFNRLQFDYPNKNDLFEAFVDFSNLSFEAHVEKFSRTHWELCGSTRCVSFWCLTNDFIIGKEYSVKDFDVAEILMLDFRRKKTIASACRLQGAGLFNSAEEINTELLFLNGSAILDDQISGLLKLNPGSQLENSLFGNDNLMHNSVENILHQDYQFCPFGEMILNKILFTCATNALKDSIYEAYIEGLGRCGGTWYQAQHFVATNRDGSDFQGFDEATVFNVIGTYPAALNIFGLHVGYNGEYYRMATQAFAEENIEHALELLQDEINFNGITSQTLNLTGACYRLLGRPAKALAYLMPAFYLDRETPYLTGNTCLCLDALGYKKLDEIAGYFLNLNTIDPWSKTQITNLIKQ